MDKNNIVEPKLLEIITSVSLAEKLELIGKKFNLHIDELGELGVIVRLIIIGKLKKEKVIGKIMEKVGVDEENAYKIVEEVNKNIIAELKDHIKEYIEVINTADNTDSQIPTENKNIDRSNDIGSIPIQIRKIEEKKPNTDEESNQNLPEIALNMLPQSVNIPVDPVPLNMTSKKISIQETKKVDISNVVPLKDPTEQPPKQVDPYREPL